MQSFNNQKPPPQTPSAKPPSAPPSAPPSSSSSSNINVTTANTNKQDQQGPQNQQQQQQKQQTQPQPQQQTMSMNKKIRKSWNNFEIRLIKSADASKFDPRKYKARSSAGSSQSQSQAAVAAAAATVESRHANVKAQCNELLHCRKELRALLNEAEANVMDNVKELKALNLLFMSSGDCMGMGSRGLKRRRVDDGGGVSNTASGKDCS